VEGSLVLLHCHLTTSINQCDHHYDNHFVSNCNGVSSDCVQQIVSAVTVCSRLCQQ
jgi:hypothetical protein